jgi:hypothetical protein
LRGSIVENGAAAGQPETGRRPSDIAEPSVLADEPEGPDRRLDGTALRVQARSRSATAWAASPSPRPVKPR